MKLYYTPGACSLSNRIMLHEAELPFDFERVDLATRTTEHGHDFAALNPKGYVPLLVLDDGARLTENIAILSLIADHAPHVVPEGPLGRIRMLEMLSFISGELHIAFKPLFHKASEAEQAAAGKRVTKLLELVADDFEGDYLFGDRFTPADAYLFVILMWARKFEIHIPPVLAEFQRRVAARDAVRQALAEEGLANTYSSIAEDLAEL